MRKDPSSCLAEIVGAAPERAERLMRVGSALRILFQRMQDAQERAARHHKLHSTDFSCIGYLYRRGEPVSPKQIIAFLGLSSGSGTALLDRLEKAGYIRRLPNPADRRSVLIALDQEAAREPIAKFVQVEQIYRQVTDHLTDTDLETIAGFLEKLTTLTPSSVLEEEDKLEVAG